MLLVVIIFGLIAYQAERFKAKNIAQENKVAACGVFSGIISMCFFISTIILLIETNKPIYHFIFSFN